MRTRGSRWWHSRWWCNWHRSRSSGSGNKARIDPQMTQILSDEISICEICVNLWMSLELPVMSVDRDPIETASADELRSLQLERLRWSLQHAYDNVPHYRQSFDAAGVHPKD